MKRFFGAYSHLLFPPIPQSLVQIKHDHAVYMMWHKVSRLTMRQRRLLKEKIRQQIDKMDKRRVFAFEENMKFGKPHVRYRLRKTTLSFDERVRVNDLIHARNRGKFGAERVLYVMPHEWVYK